MKYPTCIGVGELDSFILKDFVIGPFRFEQLKRKINDNTESRYWLQFISHYAEDEETLATRLSFKRELERTTVVDIPVMITVHS